MHLAGLRRVHVYSVVARTSRRRRDACPLRRRTAGREPGRTYLGTARAMGTRNNPAVLDLPVLLLATTGIVNNGRVPVLVSYGGGRYLLRGTPMLVLSAGTHVERAVRGVDDRMRLIAGA